MDEKKDKVSDNAESQESDEQQQSALGKTHPTEAYVQPQIERTEPEKAPVSRQPKKAYRVATSASHTPVPQKHAHFSESPDIMHIVPGPSRVNGDIFSSEVENDSVTTMKKLLPPVHKRRSTLMSYYKLHGMEKVDNAEEVQEDLHFGIDSHEADLEPRELLAAIRTLPARMKEKRDYRNELLQAAESPVGDIANLDLFFYKVKTKIRDFFKELRGKVEIWSTTFKAIEGRFGTGVVSYFVFLKFLLFMNIIIFLITTVFIVLPQAISVGNTTNLTLVVNEDVLETKILPNLPVTSKYGTEPKTSLTKQNSLSNMFGSDLGNLDDLGSLFDTYVVDGFVDATLHYSSRNYTGDMRRRVAEMCAHRYENYIRNTTNMWFLAQIQDLFQGTGWLEYTLLFTGYYKPVDLFIGNLTYNLSVAFLTVLICLLIISIVMMVLYASKGVQESMLDNSMQETYCYITFCGWDYCIEEEKAAKRHHGSIFQELTSSLAENRRKAKIETWTMRDKARVYTIRSFINLLTLLSLVGAYYLIFYVTKVQLEAERTSTVKGFNELFMQFLPSLTITSLNFIIPLFLYVLVQFEEYKIRHQINITLVRIIFLRQASTIILISSFYNQINCMPRDICHKGLDTCPSPLCWETYVGQQMYRLALLDLIVHVGVVFFWETPRNFVYKKWKNQCTEFFGKQLFDIPTQVLALVYSQTLCWLGMFYCPLLPAITVAKFIIFFYIKKFTVLTNCSPEQIPYKASRSNAIFVLVLMLSFFVTIAVLGYSVAQIQPSPGCSPYRLYDNMMHAMNNAMQQWSPELNKVLLFLLSPLFVVPLMILLCLALYYYITKTTAHKKMVKLLKVQLTMEGKDKQFLLNRVTKIKPKTQDLKRLKQL